MVYPNKHHSTDNSGTIFLFRPRVIRVEFRERLPVRTPHAPVPQRPPTPARSRGSILSPCSSVGTPRSASMPARSAATRPRPRPPGPERPRRAASTCRPRHSAWPDDLRAGPQSGAVVAERTYADIWLPKSSRQSRNSRRRGPFRPPHAWETTFSARATPSRCQAESRWTTTPLAYAGEARSFLVISPRWPKSVSPEPSWGHAVKTDALIRCLEDQVLELDLHRRSRMHLEGDDAA